MLVQLIPRIHHRTHRTPQQGHQKHQIGRKIAHWGTTRRPAPAARLASLLVLFGYVLPPASGAFAELAPLGSVLETLVFVAGARYDPVCGAEDHALGDCLEGDVLGVGVGWGWG